MFSYVVRIFSALWTVVYALLALALDIGIDVPIAVIDVETGIDGNINPIVQLAALPRQVKGVGELQSREQLDGPAIANLRDITFGSSLYSLGRLSTIEELEEEEEFEAKEREASGAEVMVDIVKTTRTLRPPKHEIGHGHEATSYPSHSWPQYDDGEGGRKSRTSSHVGHHDYDFKSLLGQDEGGVSVQDSFDLLGKLQELIVTSSRFSLDRLSTTAEFDEEEEVDAAFHKAAAEEETQIAWIHSYEGTMVPVWLRQGFTETNERRYYDTGGGSVTRESPSLQVAQCRQLAHEGFDSNANSPSPFQYDDAEDGHNSIISSSVGYDDLQMLLVHEGEQEEGLTQENIDGFIGLQKLTPTSSRYSLGRLSTIEEVDEEDFDMGDQEAGPKAMVVRMAWPSSNDIEPAYNEDKECESHGLESSSMTLESPSLQVAQWRQLVHEASDSGAISPFAFSAMYIKKTDTISFDDWSRSSSVSPPPTPTYESPDGRHTSPPPRQAEFDAPRPDSYFVVLC